MSPRFSHNAILLGLLALATAPQAFADGTSPEEQSFGDLCKIPQNPLNSHQDI